MASIRSKKGKGKYASYRSGNRLDRNKESRNKRILNRLAKRKEWRIRKYSQTPQSELSSTTITLFREWGVPLVGPKKEKKNAKTDSGQGTDTKNPNPRRRRK